MKNKITVENSYLGEIQWRVGCLHPIFEPRSQTLYGGAQLCDHGTPMTVKEMNQNLIWPGKPYIRIPYCKYCYNDDTVGVFDENPLALRHFYNAIMIEPDEENPQYYIEKFDPAPQKNLREILGDKADD